MHNRFHSDLLSGGLWEIFAQKCCLFVRNKTTLVSRRKPCLERIDGFLFWVHGTMLHKNHSINCGVDWKCVVYIVLTSHQLFQFAISFSVTEQRSWKGYWRKWMSSFIRSKPVHLSGHISTSNGGCHRARRVHTDRCSCWHLVLFCFQEKLGRTGVFWAASWLLCRSCSFSRSAIPVWTLTLKCGRTVGTCSTIKLILQTRNPCLPRNKNCLMSHSGVRWLKSRRW